MIHDESSCKGLITFSIIPWLAAYIKHPGNKGVEQVHSPEEEFFRIELQIPAPAAASAGDRLAVVGRQPSLDGIKRGVKTAGTDVQDVSSRYLFMERLIGLHRSP